MISLVNVGVPLLAMNKGCGACSLPEGSSSEYSQYLPPAYNPCIPGKTAASSTQTVPQDFSENAGQGSIVVAPASTIINVTAGCNDINCFGDDVCECKSMWNLCDEMIHVLGALATQGARYTEKLWSGKTRRALRRHTAKESGKDL